VSTSGEGEMRHEGMTNNPKCPKFSKSPSFHISTIYLIKNPNHQSLNVFGGW
jgi:hypothetical protein